jgi:hypothetical protein
MVYDGAIFGAVSSTAAYINVMVIFVIVAVKVKYC